MRSDDIMNLRIGTDVIDVERFYNLDTSSRFAKNTFTKKELSDCKKKQDPVASLAVRFAAKEAVRKCTDEPISFNKIEILNDHTGRPFIHILDRRVASRYIFSLSLSHIRTLAHAVCICISKKRFKATFKE